MKKGIVIDQTILLLIAIFVLVVMVIVYFFLTGMGGDWIDAIRQALAAGPTTP